jgi:threonine 3-dehydrogenase
MKTMHAIAKLKPGPGLDLIEVPIPTLGINDVLI